MSLIHLYLKSNPLKVLLPFPINFLFYFQNITPIFRTCIRILYMSIIVSYSTILICFLHTVTYSSVLASSTNWSSKLQKHPCWLEIVLTSKITSKIMGVWAIYRTGAVFTAENFLTLLPDNAVASVWINCSVFSIHSIEQRLSCILHQTYQRQFRNCSGDARWNSSYLGKECLGLLMALSRVPPCCFQDQAVDKHKKN